MAVVRRLERIVLERDMVHSDAECTYSIITGRDGDRSLQVDTYGSPSRQIHGKKSQSIRFSPDAIEQLRRILRDEI